MLPNVGTRDYVISSESADIKKIDLPPIIVTKLSSSVMEVPPIVVPWPASMETVVPPPPPPDHGSDTIRYYRY